MVDRKIDKNPLSRTAHPSHPDRREDADGQVYLRTEEAAGYMRRSVSWLLRQPIPHLAGKPNLYSVEDLDQWFDRNKHVPRV